MSVSCVSALAVAFPLCDRNVAARANNGHGHRLLLLLLLPWRPSNAKQVSYRHIYLLLFLFLSNTYRPHCCWWCFCGHSYNIYRCRWRCWRTSNCVMMNKCSTMADTVHHARRQMEERMLHLSFIFVCVGEKITIFYRMSGHKNIPFSFEYTCMQVMCGGYAGILAYFYIRFHSFDVNTLMWCVCV